MRPNAFTGFLKSACANVTGSQALGVVFTALPILTCSHGLRTASRVFDFRLRMFRRIRGHKFAGIETLDEFPRLKAWFDRIEPRAAVQAGFTIPKAQ